MAGSIFITTGYPHELLGHIKRLDGAENISFLEDSDRLLYAYKNNYPEYTHGIRELEAAVRLGIINEMIEIFSEPMWRKRSFINKTAIRLMNEGGLKEHEMVEFLESFIQLFGWDIEMEMARRWETTEEYSAEWYKANHSRTVNYSDVNRDYEDGAEDGSTEDNTWDNTDDRSDNSSIYTDADITGSSYNKSGTSIHNADKSSNDSAIDRKNSNIVGSNKDSSNSSGNSNSRGSSVETHRTASADPSKYVEDYEVSRIDSLFEHMSPREYIANEILKSGLKFERLMSSSVRRDARKAVNGNVDAQCRMGSYYAEPDTVHTDYVEAVKWYKLAASQGNNKAQFELGMLYDSGRIKCEDYKKKAISCYMSLAESGFPTAQCTIGLKYRFGDGVEENLDEAIKWFKKSANQGHVDAQRNLGDIYSGLGNNEEALKWYSRAAALGDVYSEKRIR